MDDRSTPVTHLLDAASRGEGGATDKLLPVVYDELRRLAANLMSREQPGLTLQPTALVHEAYLRLIGPANVSWQNRAHFFGAAALAMRRILIDRARHVKSARVQAGSLDESAVAGGTETFGADQNADDLIALDDALESLRSRDDRQHEVVMLRYFAGLTIDQTAMALDLSPSTVKNEWSYARAWLMREMEAHRGGSHPGRAA